MRRIVFLAAAALPLGLAGGCSRSTDGSFEAPEPYFAQSFVPGMPMLGWRRPRLDPPRETTEFPPPPSEESSATKPSRDRRQTPAPRHRRAAMQASQAEPVSGGKIVCRDVTNSQGRARVVCE